MKPSVIPRFQEGVHAWTLPARRSGELLGSPQEAAVDRRSGDWPLAPGADPDGYLLETPLGVVEGAL